MTISSINITTTGQTGIHSVQIVKSAVIKKTSVHGGWSEIKQCWLNGGILAISENEGYNSEFVCVVTVILCYLTEKISMDGTECLTDLWLSKPS